MTKGKIEVTPYGSFQGLKHMYVVYADVASDDCCTVSWIFLPDVVQHESSPLRQTLAPEKRFILFDSAFFGPDLVGCVQRSAVT
jgi:hypothetical protein